MPSQRRRKQFPLIATAVALAALAAGPQANAAVTLGGDPTAVTDGAACPLPLGCGAVQFTRTGVSQAATDGVIVRWRASGIGLGAVFVAALQPNGTATRVRTSA